MKESTTYQAILAEGRAEGEARGRAEGELEGRAGEARLMLLRIGSKRLGAPDSTTLATLASIQEVAHLEDLAVRTLDVESWSELFGPG